VIFYIIELDQLLVATLGGFYFMTEADFSSRVEHCFNIYAPSEVTKENLFNYTLVYIGDL